VVRNVIRLIFPVLLILLPVTSHAEGSRSFVEAEHAFYRLCKDPHSTREKWLDVIGTFLKLHRGDRTRSTAVRSLLYAGRAYLELHRRTGNREDLDHAIECLQDFDLLNRPQGSVRDNVLATQTALTLRKRLDRLALVHRAGASALKDSTGSQETSTETKVIQGPWHGPAGQSGAMARNASTTSPRGNNPGRVALLYRGNPFCPPDARTFIGIPLPLESESEPPEPKQTGRQRVIPHASPGKRFVIVIDPGHGGKDPGAVSPGGRLKEKDVVLNISRRLREMLLRRNPAITVVLTRTDDRFLSLGQRAAVANSLNADLFISVHCNSSTEFRSRGIETYYLSPACSHKALATAARENGIPLSKMSDLQATLLDLSLASKRSGSARLAQAIHTAVVRKVGRAIPPSADRGIRRGPFNVLLAAQMPAVLVEVAFMSSRADSRLLKSPTYLTRLAAGMANGAEVFIQGTQKRAWTTRRSR
jgi:N-acetylmuramoyl-L-alanine amidase